MLVFSTSAGGVRHKTEAVVQKLFIGSPLFFFIGVMISHYLVQDFQRDLSNTQEVSFGIFGEFSLIIQGKVLLQEVKQSR